jgi:glucosamine-phosphate N-acetyltransferase
VSIVCQREQQSATCVVTIRPLFGPDFDRGFIELLSQLSPTHLNRETASQIFRQRLKCGIRTWIALDGDKLVGSASLFIEPKYIHSGASVAHIEDVVVDRSYRGKAIGLKLMEHLEMEARSAGCYKLVLECSEQNEPFYLRSGFHRHEMQMRKDLEVASNSD